MCLAKEKPSPKPSALRLPPNKINKECVAASSAVPWGHLTADSSKAEFKLGDGHLSHTSLNTYGVKLYLRWISREISLNNIFYPHSQGEQNKRIEKGIV
jgi:hypothetical protein